jgi:hypothetical protein
MKYGVYTIHMSKITGATPLKLLHILFDPVLLKRMDDFRFKNRIEGRSEAIRWLAKAALDQKLTPKALEKGD